MAVQEMTDVISMTEVAADKFKEMRDAEEHTDFNLRVQVVGGGCSGFQYKLAFDNETADDDEMCETNGVTVVIDPMSARFVEGAVIDYVETMMGAGFKVENPNATGTCGCGSSFQA